MGREEATGKRGEGQMHNSLLFIDHGIGSINCMHGRDVHDGCIEVQHCMQDGGSGHA